MEITTNTSYITFTPLEQLAITKTTRNFPQDLALTAACLPGATKNFIRAWLGNWNFCKSCGLTWKVQKLSIVIQQKYLIGRKTQSETAFPEKIWILLEFAETNFYCQRNISRVNLVSNKKHYKKLLCNNFLQPKKRKPKQVALVYSYGTSHARTFLTVCCFWMDSCRYLAHAVNLLQLLEARNTL